MNGQTDLIAPPLLRVRARVLDYVELMKPELTGLSVLTALCAFYLGTTDTFSFALFLHTALGTLLVGGGAGALNRYIERSYDAMMKRTERRPLPSGRLDPREALVFGILISLIGIAELTIFTNPLAGLLAGVTWSTYLFLYTPLKRITPLSTVIGGIPGALPPLIGWAATRNSLNLEAWVLFAILFFWQMPHFFSLAWMYRKDYARAGFKVLSVSDAAGQRTSKQIFYYCAGLIPASIAPTLLGMTGIQSLVAALVLGAGFLTFAGFLLHHSLRAQPDAMAKVNRSARQIFFSSLVYLPALMIVLSIDKMS